MAREADVPDRELVWSWPVEGPWAWLWEIGHVDSGREVGGAHARELWLLWQKPPSPGKQLEQGTPSLTQAHRKHLAVPLHLQQRDAPRRVYVYALQLIALVVRVLARCLAIFD